MRYLQEAIARRLKAYYTQPRYTQSLVNTDRFENRLVRNILVVILVLFAPLHAYLRNAVLNPMGILRWLGYLALDTVTLGICAVTAYNLFYMLWAFKRTLRLFGPEGFACSCRMLNIKSQTSKRRENLLGALILLATLLLLGISLWLATGIIYFLGLVALSLMITIVPVLDTLPPSVLFLASTRPETIQLNVNVGRCVAPLKVVSLLDLQQAPSKEFTWYMAPLDLRTHNEAQWQATVSALMEIARVIVIDVRYEGSCVQLECELISDSPELMAKAFFVTGDRGEQALLEVLKEGSMERYASLRLVTEKELLEELFDFAKVKTGKDRNVLIAR